LEQFELLEGLHAIAPRSALRQCGSRLLRRAHDRRPIVLPDGLLIPPRYVAVSIGVDKPSMSVSEIVLPVALVDGAIRPLLLAESVALLVFPLADVDCSGLVLLEESGFECVAT
jgi:hypothetical protein